MRVTPKTLLANQKRCARPCSGQFRATQRRQRRGVGGANDESGKRVRRERCTGYTDACQTDLRATSREESLGCTGKHGVSLATSRSRATPRGTHRSRRTLKSVNRFARLAARRICQSVNSPVVGNKVRQDLGFTRAPATSGCTYRPVRPLRGHLPGCSRLPCT